MQRQFQNMNKTILPAEELIHITQERMTMAKPQKWIIRLPKTVAAVICTILIFVGVVNLSSAFASAAAKVPIMRDLVAAVSFDPSMKTAIAHNYVQLVKQSDKDNDYYLNVEYLVADQANLTVYYRLKGFSDHISFYQIDNEINDTAGMRLKGYNASWSLVNDDNALWCVKFHFLEGALPEKVQLAVTVKEEQNDSAIPLQTTEDVMKNSRNLISSLGEEKPAYETVAELQVPLVINHNSLFHVQTVHLNQTIEVAGQKLTIEKVERYPTQLRLLWQEDESNESLITSIMFALQGQKQGRWETIHNGASGIGMPGEARQTWLESNWFSEKDNYQLQIEGLSLLPKQQQPITYDYRTNTIANLPNYIRLKEATPCETGLYLNFEIQSTDSIVSSVFSTEYLDSNGTKQSMDSQGASSGITDFEKGENHIFKNDFVVKNYEKGPITLYLQWAPPQQLTEPIVIPLTEH